jgi:hypothetical protein
VQTGGEACRGGDRASFGGLPYDSGEGASLWSMLRCGGQSMGEWDMQAMHGEAAWVIHGEATGVTMAKL